MRPVKISNHRTLVSTLGLKKAVSKKNGSTSLVWLQLSAIRAACRSDFMARCSGVQPGSAAALQCLQRNSTALSATCQNAVAAIERSARAPTISAPNATAAAQAVAPLGPVPPMRPRAAFAILRLCSADQRQFCSGVEPGGGRMISCLAQNAAALSPRCYAALSTVANR
jgi:hypothetical protein